MSGWSLLPEQLEAIRVRWAKAAPGPWVDTVTDEGQLLVQFGPTIKAAKATGMYAWSVRFGSMEDTEGADHRTAAAVAAAPADVLALLEHIAAQEATAGTLGGRLTALEAAQAGLSQRIDAVSRARSNATTDLAHLTTELRAMRKGVR